MTGAHIALFVSGFFLGALALYLWNPIPYSSGYIEGFRAGWNACKDGKECL